MIINKYNQHLQNNTFSTLFVGQNLITLATVDSTNNFLKSLLSNSEPVPEGTVIMAEDQFAGRGQQSAKWLTEPGKNLTFSVFLKPSFLSLHRQFLLNMAISIGLNEALGSFLGEGVFIKWPNDIYYKDKKLGGVLIENTVAGSHLKTSVIGVGINVNQRVFREDLTEKAISMIQILQKDVSLINLLAEICSHIEKTYIQLNSRTYRLLKENYIERLYRYGEIAWFESNGEVFEGVITGVADSGQLYVNREGFLSEFNFKEIQFLNHL